MKLQWGIFLGLLLILQLVGHFIIGKSEPLAALCVIAYPSSILSGGYFAYLFYRDKTAIFAPPLLLILVQVEIVYATRRAPRDSLMAHAMSQFLGYEVAPIESYLGSGVLLFFMFTTAVISAFLAAEIGGRLTRQPGVSGKNLLRGAWQGFLRWEKNNVKTKADH